VTSQQAKEILALYRPDAGAADPQMAEALEQVQRDPELRRWFEQHRAFQAAMRAKFRQIPVPQHLRETILASNPIVRPVWWQRRAWLATAAALALLLALSALWLAPRSNNRFSEYRSRMVRDALRQYQMDVVTNDLREVRQFVAQRGAPADYAVTNGLETLSVTGGGCLNWRGHPVAMTCFDRGDSQMVFLFVIARSALKDAPPAARQLAKVNKLLTASWTEGNKTYLLAGPQDTALLRKP